MCCSFTVPGDSLSQLTKANLETNHWQNDGRLSTNVFRTRARNGSINFFSQVARIIFVLVLFIRSFLPATQTIFVV